MVNVAKSVNSRDVPTDSQSLANTRKPTEGREYDRLLREKSIKASESSKGYVNGSQTDGRTRGYYF
jgi:hypothetical protein